MQLPFDPKNPFGDVPPAMDMSAPVGIGAEIEQLSAEFAALGMNAHHTVTLWLGKPNRFTSIIMRSAKEVLDYVSAELAEQAQARAAAHATGTPASGAGDDQGVVTAAEAGDSKTAARAALQARREAHKEQERLAGDAWRKAIRDRDAAMLEWNKYVENLRLAFNALKQNRPR